MDDSEGAGGGGKLAGACGNSWAGVALGSLGIGAGGVCCPCPSAEGWADAAGGCDGGFSGSRLKGEGGDADCGTSAGVGEGAAAGPP